MCVEFEFIWIHRHQLLRILALAGLHPSHQQVEMMTMHDDRSFHSARASIQPPGRKREKRHAPSPRPLASFSESEGEGVNRKVWWCVWIPLPTVLMNENEMFRFQRQGDKLPHTFIHYHLLPPPWSRSWSSFIILWVSVCMAGIVWYSRCMLYPVELEIGVSNIDAIGDGDGMGGRGQHSTRTTDYWSHHDIMCTMDLVFDTTPK